MPSAAGQPQEAEAHAGLEPWDSVIHTLVGTSLQPCPWIGLPLSLPAASENGAAAGREMVRKTPASRSGVPCKAQTFLPSQSFLCVWGGGGGTPVTLLSY